MNRNPILGSNQREPKVIAVRFLECYVEEDPVVTNTDHALTDRLWVDNIRCTFSFAPPAHCSHFSIEQIPST